MDSEELYEGGGWYGVRGYFNWLETKTYKMHVRVLLSRYRAYTLCPECDGGRFQPATLNYRLVPVRRFAVGGQARQTASRRCPVTTCPQLAQLSVIGPRRSDGFAHAPRPTTRAREMLHKEITNRLRYLVAVGLGYLNLDRPTRTPLRRRDRTRQPDGPASARRWSTPSSSSTNPVSGCTRATWAGSSASWKTSATRGTPSLSSSTRKPSIRAADNLIDIGPGRGEAGGELVYRRPAHGTRQLRGVVDRRLPDGKKIDSAARQPAPGQKMAEDRRRPRT